MNQIKKGKNLFFGVILSQLLLTGCNPGNIKEAESDRDTQKVEEVLRGAGLDIASVEEALVKAEKATQSGNKDLAQLYYIKAYDLEPTNVQVLQKMSDLYIELKKYDLAEVSLKMLLKQKPDDLKIREQYGLLLIKLKKYSEAEENLNRVVSTQQSWRAYNGLGIIANLQGNPAKAISFFKKADEILPNSPELLNNIGFALYSDNQMEEAASFYVKALQINSGYKKAIYNYALLQARTNNYEQAYINFAKVSSPAEAYNNTGYIAMMNGNYEEANHYLNEAIKASPRFYKKAHDNLKRLELLEKVAVAN